MPVRSDVGTPPAATLAGEPGFDVREPDIIAPSVAADRRPMAALIIGAIDQETANAAGTHFSEGDFLAGEGGGHLNRPSSARRRFPNVSFSNRNQKSLPEALP
jgi:hypothetical protein